MHYLESKSSSDELYDALKVVWFQGKSALNHIHGKGIVHNDISPSNIIVVSSEPLKLCLIDFGIACPIGYDLPFYCGTKSYSHNDLLKKYPNGCTTRIEYDKYSLALPSLATWNGGKARWDMSGFKTDREAVLKERNILLEELISKIKETEFRDELEKLVGWTKSKQKDSSN